ncbi:DoxX family protein [Pedobacter frigiditerrae]|uniref:DoxX family protein n=1 Tax=Pedobacter frigiditerrae TaxID=2530452 RepID=A0A4R0MLG9_9SPHI|nr:DoxX family protein [Pedobacter frigiditerrae]TCC87257.1 DoxX family protein [Pedobacter frigiditerrae]
MKKNKIIFWVATAIIILWEGIMPLSTILFTPEYVTVGTRPLGYPDYFAYALIICKALGTLAIALPQTPSRLKEWAYAGLTFSLIFAFISHACVDKNIMYMLLPIIVLAILMVSYTFNRKLNLNNNGK